jgi:protein dithiol oxidoreductase (disulfide-forming)
MFRFLVLFLAIGFAPLTSAAQFDEGIDYARIEPAVATANRDRVEVVELFWYGCPHCFHFEPHLKGWLIGKPADVDFVRIPAVFSDARWALHARTFYGAEQLGVLNRLHDVIFEAMHLYKRPLANEREIRALFVANGVSESEFDKVFSNNNFALESKVRRAREMTRRYGITGVPVVIVNGKYRVDGPMAGTYERLIQIVRHLVELEQQALAKR